MLMSCPECNLMVSDKAVNCPHCGYPLKESSRKTRKKNKRRRKLPNGFGQISELKGRNLRKPFRAMVTVGKDEYGRPIAKPLRPDSYFETYNEAYMALVEYNRNPFDLRNTMTLQDLYEKWLEDYIEQGSSKKTVRTYQSVWKQLPLIKNMLVINIRAQHIRDALGEGLVQTEENTISPKMKNLMKVILNQVFDFAVANQIVDRNFARDVKLTKKSMKAISTVDKEHLTFTKEEIETLWNHIEEPMVDLILCQCYTGMRPTELLAILTDNVDLASWKIVGGGKTKAGTNREIPIHKRIRPIIEKYYSQSKKAKRSSLFGKPDREGQLQDITYSRYSLDFKNIMKRLGLDANHRPHDCRVFFITRAKECNVDEYAIKRIVGHRIGDITEGTYTKRDFGWLQAEMNKIL